ncbi:sensor histidine kinase [Nakamurella flava]|uniref:Sensor histidine kinase n=1 Tax=Nakamurella flava TaxID=2576308 RepID=A0A4U6QMF9_9ACTN|nr:histidine kinase [Nakamurella flava]TKV61601.1 sensor histidine kinase [Nakamurella flava]
MTQARTTALLERTGWRWTPGSREWVFGSLVALVFPVFYLTGVWQAVAPVSTKVVATVLMVVAMVWYAIGPAGLVHDGLPTRTAAGYVAVTALLFGVQMLVIGPGAASMLIFPSVAGGLLLPRKWSLTVAFAVAAVIVGTSWSSPDGASWELAGVQIAVTLWMMGFAGNIRLTRELYATREQLARTAVAAERERIGRDLHDILGHSLTAISVKAGLARKLVPIAPERATAELTEIEDLARSAIKDVRATAQGVRAVTLAGELAVARAVLDSAGVAADLPSAVDNVRADGRELFGFVVREAVTNVVRHAQASACRIDLGPNWVEIADDGRGLDERSATGSGLAGLDGRLTEAGGRLTVARREPRGTVVRAELAAAR